MLILCVTLAPIREEGAACLLTVASLDPNPLTTAHASPRRRVVFAC